MTDSQWTVEAAIPLASLVTGLDVDDHWGANFTYHDRSHTAVSGWSLDGMHKPGRFGHLLLAPGLGRFYRPDLGKWIREKSAKIDDLADAIPELDLPSDIAVEVTSSLKDLQTKVRSLDTITLSADRLPDGGWPTVKRTQARMSEQFDDIRHGVIQALFSVHTSPAWSLVHGIRNLRSHVDPLVQ